MAVIALGEEYFNSAASLKPALARLIGFRPRTILVLDQLGRPAPDHLRALAEEVLPAFSEPRPRLAGPEGERRIFSLVPGDKSQDWLFVDSALIERANPEQMKEALNSLAGQLQRRADQPLTASSLLLWADADFRRSVQSRQDVWPQLQAVLDNNAEHVQVVVGGGNRFSWWREDGRDYFSVPVLARGVNRPMSLPTGEFDGFLWGEPEADGKMNFRAIAWSGIIEREEMNRQDQLIVDILNANLSASAFSDSNPTTRVALRNTTGRRLQFTARWQAAKEIQVEPRVVGFTLEPGGVFAQQFRLQPVAAGPLKFLAPRLVLQTGIAGPGGRPRQVELQAEPWGRINASAAFAEEPKTIDGNLDDWTQPGLQLNHAIQVIAGREAWGGPADLSGIVRLAYDHDHLYIAVRVIDDQIGNPENLPGREKACVYVLLGSVDQAEAPPSNAPGMAPPNPMPPILKLCAEPSGAVQISSIPDGTVPAGIRSAVALADNGYVAEFALPAQGFAGPGIPDPLLLDVALHDFELADDTPPRAKIMQLSGRRLDPELFAIVRLQPSPSTVEDEVGVDEEEEADDEDGDGDRTELHDLAD